MKNIVALVDFTRVCEAAIAQAGRIARKTDARLTLLNIAPEDKRGDRDELISEINVFAEVLGTKPINLELHVEFGDFFTIIGNVLQMLKTDLVVIGTHGIRGKQRNLFSKNIAHLLKELQVPALIVQGQRDQAPSELNAWLLAGEHLDENLPLISWARDAYDAELVISKNTENIDEIETEAFDNDCSLIVWHGNADDGMDLILNHFGIPVLLL